MSMQFVSKTDSQVVSARPLSKKDLEAGNLFVAQGPMGTVLRYGRLIAYPDSLRESVLMMPLREYLTLGYVDPNQAHLLENYAGYDLENRRTVHVSVTDSYDYPLFNVNFVVEEPLPTTELFELEGAFMPELGSVNEFIQLNRLEVAEPSRLVGIPARKYANEYEQNVLTGFNPLQIHSMARHILAIGIDLATKSMSTKWWLFNFDKNNAGAFVSKVAGHDLGIMSGVVIRPESYTGPFGPYFSSHGTENPIFVTLTDALEIAQKMGSNGREAVNKYLSKIKQ